MCFQVVFEQSVLNLFSPNCQPTGRLKVCFQVVFEQCALNFVRSKLPADREIESANYYKFCFICQSVSSCQPSVSLDSFV